MLVVVLGGEPYLRAQITGTREGVAPDGLLGDEGKPPFDLIKPGGVGRFTEFARSTTLKPNVWD